MPRRLTPIRGRGANTVRYLTRAGGGTSTWRGSSGTSIMWGSCANNTRTAFRSDYKPTFTNGFYLANSDLALLGLLATIPASLALAWIGPAAAYFTTGPAGLLYSSASVGQAVLTALAAAGLSGMIKPQSAQFASFDRPCSEDRGRDF